MADPEGTEGRPGPEGPLTWDWRWLRVWQLFNVEAGLALVLVIVLRTVRL